MALKGFIVARDHPRDDLRVLTGPLPTPGELLSPLSDSKFFHLPEDSSLIFLQLP